MLAFHVLFLWWGNYSWLTGLTIAGLQMATTSSFFLSKISSHRVQVAFFTSLAILRFPYRRLVHGFPLECLGPVKGTLPYVAYLV